MGNWLVSPEQEKQQYKEWEHGFNQEIYQDLAISRQETENDINNTEKDVLNGVISRARGNERIAAIKKHQLEYESNMIKIIKEK